MIDFTISKLRICGNCKFYKKRFNANLRYSSGDCKNSKSLWYDWIIRYFDVRHCYEENNYEV